MSGRNHPGGWGCVKGGWSPVAVGWSDDQGCSGSWDGATGDAPAEQRPEQERTPCRKGQRPAAYSREHNELGQGEWP